MFVANELDSSIPSMANYSVSVIACGRFSGLRNVTYLNPGMVVGR
jgi:hypothetical protein